MLPRQLLWKPKDETTQNHEQEGDDAGVLDASQSLMPYTIERDPTMQVPYARKEPSQPSRSVANDSSITGIDQNDRIRPESDLGWTVRVKEESETRRRTLPIPRRVLQQIGRRYAWSLAGGNDLRASLREGDDLRLEGKNRPGNGKKPNH